MDFRQWGGSMAGAGLEEFWHFWDEKYGKLSPNLNLHFEVYLKLIVLVWTHQIFLCRTSFWFDWTMEILLAAITCTILITSKVLITVFNYSSYCQEELLKLYVPFVGAICDILSDEMANIYDAICGIILHIPRCRKVEKCFAPWQHIVFHALLCIFSANVRSHRCWKLRS